jgi:hypothetical protein
MPPNLLEIFRQMSFFSSVLAGFAIAVAIELIALGNKGLLASSAAAMFIISSATSVVATFASVIILNAATGLPGLTQPSEAWVMHYVGLGILPTGSLVLFLAGIGLIGWLHSKPLGIVSTISAALGFVLVIALLRSIISL